jgi:hypothetical protein
MSKKLAFENNGELALCNYCGEELKVGLLSAFRKDKDKQKFVLCGECHTISLVTFGLGLEVKNLENLPSESSDTFFTALAEAIRLFREVGIGVVDSRLMSEQDDPHNECEEDEYEEDEYEEDDVAKMAKGFRRLLLLLGED